MIEHKFIDKRIAFVDLETTGLRAGKDGIVQIAMRIAEGKRTIWQRVEYCNPGVPMTSRATEISGITDEMVKDKEKSDLVVRTYFEQAKLLECSVIAGHNLLGFDKKFLVEAVGKEYYEEVFADEIDTLLMARNTKAFGRCKLSIVADALGYEATGFHDAMVDVDVCHEIYLRLDDLDHYLLKKEEIIDVKAEMSLSKEPIKLSEVAPIQYEFSEDVLSKTTIPIEAKESVREERQEQLVISGTDKAPAQYNSPCILLQYRYNAKYDDHQIHMHLMNGNEYFYSIKQAQWCTFDRYENLKDNAIQAALMERAEKQMRLMYHSTGIRNYRKNYRSPGYDRFMKRAAEKRTAK